MQKNLLIVDDEIAIRNLLKSLLTDLGYNVFLAESGEEALEILAKNPISVMFFDIQLPGMTGIDLCKKIRENNRIAVIYAMTGFSKIFQLDECREAGFDDYFAKPFEIMDLVKATQDGFEKIERWSKKQNAP